VGQGAVKHAGSAAPRRFALAWSSWASSFAAFLGLIFLADLQSGPARSLLPVYCEEVLQQAPRFSAALVSAQLVCGAVAAVAAGRLSRHLSQRQLLLLGLAGGPLAGLAFQVKAGWALAAIWSLYGLVRGLYTVAYQLFLLRLVPARHVALGAALGATGLTLGGALGNGVAAWALQRSGFAGLGQLMTAAAVAVFALGVVLLPKGSAGEAEARVAARGARRRAALPGRAAALILTVRFLPTCYWGVATLLLPLLLYRATGAASTAALYGTVSLVFSAFCQLLAGRALDSLGVRRLVPAFVALIVLSSLGTAAALTRPAALFAAGVLGAAAAWSLSCAIPKLVSRAIPAEEQGHVLGLAHFAWNVAMLLGTQLAGALVEREPGLPFLLVGVANVAAIWAAVALGWGLRR